MECFVEVDPINLSACGCARARSESLRRDCLRMSSLIERLSCDCVRAPSITFTALYRRDVYAKCEIKRFIAEGARRRNYAKPKEIDGPTLHVLLVTTNAHELPDTTQRKNLAIFQKPLGGVFGKFDNRNCQRREMTKVAPTNSSRQVRISFNVCASALLS